MTSVHQPVGLSDAEVAARRAADGPNELPPPARTPLLRQLLDQVTHFFARMLWAAAVLAAIAGMPQLAIAIAVVVLVNGAFAFLQEHRAEQAATRLHDLMPRRATVVRDGRVSIVDAAELVVDDIVLLTAGDRISADLDLIDGTALGVDTSTMTGESVPERPSPGDRLLAGTFVVEGEGTARVHATGGRTELAALARLTQQGGRRRTPLALELERLVRVIGAIAIGVGVGFFCIALLVGMAPSDGFLFAVGVMVALVPEGLLPTVTLSLAVGAQRMADRHALVRRLEAVETLGATTFICTDKTGTLTRNEMSVVVVWAPSADVAVDDGDGYDPSIPSTCTGPELDAVRQVAMVARRCSDGRVEQGPDGRWRPVGDPMEAAIDVLCRRVGVEQPPPPARRFPFDPRRRRMSVAHDHTLSVKGAPDAVLPRCRPVDGAADVVDRCAAAGLRVLAVATRQLGDEALQDADEIETDLDLIGLLAFQDPPRAAAAASIARCRHAGMKVAMVTGDHPATARAIAADVGLLLEGSIVMTGDELPTDEQLLGATVDVDGAVIARVNPEDKLRIAHALRGRGHVVAMTGDGVNDGPALHEADIGIAMGRSGTDVARESADLVLLDDDFATVVAAVEQGRATFGNIRRFLTYHLTDNVAELAPFVIWAMSGGAFPLALGVLQVLALDIGTDLLPALALGAEPPRPGLLDRPPITGHLIDRRLLRRAFGRFGPTEAIIEMIAFVLTLVAWGWRPGDAFPGGAPLAAASGAAFSAVVFGQMATALACRSTHRWVGATGFSGNRLLAGAIAVELVTLAAFLSIEPVAHLLEHQMPTAIGLAVALTAVPAIIIVDLLDKRSHRSAIDEVSGRWARTHRG